MRWFHNENGYSLLELIVTIGLISIAIGFTTFGLNSLYTSNVNTYASRIVNDIKLVQTKEMASNNIDYRLILGHDGQHYTVDLYSKASTEVWTGSTTLLKHYELPNAMILKKYNGADFVDIKDASFTTAGDLTFEFDVSSGKILYGSGAGRYEITSTTTERTVVFVAVEQNGRVYIDE